MPKAKKYSLDYWVKKCMNAWSPEKDILAAVQEFVKSGTHSHIEFSGTPLEFATALYVSRFKRGTPWTGFFPTPAASAEQAASLLPINQGAVVLDPGCGFGALSHAVQQRGAVPIMVEYSSAVIPIAQAIWGEERVQYRDFLDGFRPTEFDAVATNPPFGNVFGHSDAAGDFLDRIADLSRSGTYVSAILPRGYLDAERPKRRVEIAQRFTIIDREDWPEDTFAPLTKISTTLYLLTVKRDGWLIREVLPRETAARASAAATPQADQHAVCSHCQAVHSDVRQALKAGWVIDAPYLFCSKCVASGIHAPSRTAGTDLAVTAVLPVPDYLPTDYARAEWQRTLDAFEAARGKEPWQMTRDEFFATHRPFSDGAQHHTLLQLIVNHEFDVVPRGGAEEVSHAILERAVEYLDRLRETLVQIALAEGKPVPSEVLREFPDLVAAQRKRDASRSVSAANDSAAMDHADEHLDAVAAEKTPAKNPRKKAPVAATSALDIPAVWHDPADFGIEVDGEEALVHYDGRDNTGFDHGALWFEFRGPTISSTGYRSHFANLKDVQASGSPQAAARDIAARLAVELAAEVKKAKKKWPLKPVEDMAVQVEGAVRRAKLISWNDFNEWWSVWLRRERESVQIKQADVIGEWTTYFASHLNPGDHVVYRSVSEVLHGQVVRVVPGSACVVEVQQQSNVSHTNLVSPGDLIGLWDELSPAERGERFEVPTFGLARNPFDMDRAVFDAWVQAADPMHGVEWSQAYRYFAERYALDDAAWSFFENNPHFIEKRRAIDPHLTSNPFDAPQDQFIRWLQSHAAGTEAQAAYLMGYAHLTSGSEVVLPEAKAYLATQPLYTAALAARQAAAETEPVAALFAVDALCRFNDARDWEIWYNQHRADIPCFIPPAPLPSRYEIFEIRVGLTAARLKAYLRRGARVEFKDMQSDPHVGEFEKWQRNGAALINQFNAQHEIAGSFSVSLERIETITLDFTDKPKADRAAAKAVVVKRPTGLPADVPEVIEVDVGGRQPVWVLATIIKVAGPQLTCQRQDDQSTLKTPLYGRDIVWRVPMAA